MLSVGILLSSEKLRKTCKTQLVKFLFGVEFDYEIHVYQSRRECLDRNEYHQLMILSDVYQNYHGDCLCRVLLERYPTMNILFITSELKCMSEAFGVNVVGCILKDEVEHKLERVINNWFYSHYLSKYHRLVIRTKESVFSMSYDEVLMVTLQQRRVYVVTLDGELIQTSYRILNNFVREHRHPYFRKANCYSYVNLNEIKKIEKNQIHFHESDLVIPVSRNESKGFKDYFFNLLNRNFDQLEF